MKVWGAGSANEQLSTEQRIAPSCLPAFLTSFAGYRGCALLAKALLFSFHKARESLTKDSPTCSPSCLVPFSPMYVRIVSFVPHLTIANRYCIPSSATSVTLMKSHGN